MLYFVIPLRAASTTSDWLGVCRLLERTLASACGQLHDSYRVVIVCHDRPLGVHIPDHCEFVDVSFPPPLLEPTDNGRVRLFRMHSDKGRKLLRGLERVRSVPESYVMFLDADDLVSNRLAGFVAEHAGSNGWFIDRGYRMDEKFRHVVFWRRRFYEECGSSYVIRSSLAPFPERLDDTLDFKDYFVRRYVGHAYVRDDLAKRGTPLDPLPFYGAIYSFNGQNIYASEYRRSDSLWRNAARLVLKGRWVTSPLRREFGIHPLRDSQNVVREIRR